MTRTAINLVTDEGLDPTGKTDSLDAWKRGVAAALKERLPLELPGKDTVSTVSDTIDVALGSNAVAIVGDGGKVQTSGGWKLPPRGGRPGAEGDQQGRHLFTAHDGAAMVVRDIRFDYRGAHNPECVGDILRFTRIGSLDVKNCPQYNPRGLTTLSSPTMPETFTLQLLHVAEAIVDACSALALDGAPTATGLVAHFCDDVTIRNSVAAFLRGQGFGVYSSRLVRWYALWSHNNHNNYNEETGPNGTGQVLIGSKDHPELHCLSSSATGAGLNVNRNRGGSFTGPGVDVFGLESNADRSVLRTVGKLGSGPADQVPVILNNVVVRDPVLNVVNIIGGGDPADIGIRGMELHNAHGVPLLAPRNLEVPAKWDVHTDADAARA